jgi:hypothetical protein
MKRVDQGIAQQSRGVVGEVEDPVLEPLRKGCKRVGKETGSKLVLRLDAGRVSGASLSTQLAVGVERVVKNFEHQRLAASAGGAVAGAAIGSVIPGVGTAVGAAVGALAGLFKTLGSLKQRCIAELSNGLGEAKRDLHRQAETLAARIRRDIHGAIELGFAEALTSYQSWFDRVVTAERAQVEEARRQFSSVIRIREALVRHDQALSAHRQQVMEVWPRRMTARRLARARTSACRASVRSGSRCRGSCGASDFASCPVRPSPMAGSTTRSRASPISCAGSAPIPAGISESSRSSS